jgi:hypothetical protein
LVDRFARPVAVRPAAGAYLMRPSASQRTARAQCANAANLSLLSDLIATPRFFFHRSQFRPEKAVSRVEFCFVAGVTSDGDGPDRQGCRGWGWRSGPRLFGEKALYCTAHRRPLSNEFPLTKTAKLAQSGLFLFPAQSKVFGGPLAAPTDTASGTKDRPLPLPV